MGPLKRAAAFLFVALLFLAGCGPGPKSRAPFVPQSPLWPVSPLARALATVPPPLPSATPWPGAASPALYTPPPTWTPLPPLGLPTLTPPFEEPRALTPTPLPLPAEWVRQALAIDQGIPVEHLYLDEHAVVKHPLTGEREWIGHFQAPYESRDFWVMVDAAGQLHPAPDFSEKARAWAAAQAGVAPGTVLVTNHVVVLFPFTEQYLWFAKLLALDNPNWTGEIVLDLAGRPADEQRIRAAEEVAQRSQCGAMGASICQLALEAPDDLLPFAFALQSAADPLSLAAQVEQAGYTWKTSYDNRIVARLPAQLALALAHDPAVLSAERAAQVGLVEPLDTALLLDFSEEAGIITLHMRTQKQFSCLGYRVSAQLEHADKGISVQVAGIEEPTGSCAAVVGPAIGELKLGALEGEYELRLTYQDVQDVYGLTVTAGELTVRPASQRFTWSKYLSWLRLPPDAVWFVIADKFPLTTSESRERSARFYAEVEAAGAHRFFLEEGPYTHPHFIPPWPSWWRVVGETVRTPASSVSGFDAFFEFHRPDIRYYHYNGDWRALAALVDAYTQDGKTLVQGYSASGENAY